MPFIIDREEKDGLLTRTGPEIPLRVLRGDRSFGPASTEDNEVTGVSDDTVVWERDWNMLLLAVLSVRVALESLLLTTDVGLGRGGTEAFGDEVVHFWYRAFVTVGAVDVVSHECYCFVVHAEDALGQIWYKRVEQ